MAVGMVWAGRDVALGGENGRAGEGEKRTAKGEGEEGQPAEKGRGRGEAEVEEKWIGGGKKE